MYKSTFFTLQYISKKNCNLQYINFKYENCVFLALKVVKIPELQGAGALPLNPAGGLGSWLSWFCISKCWQLWIIFSAYNIYLSFYLSSNINWLGLIYCISYACTILFKCFSKLVQFHEGAGYMENCGYRGETFIVYIQSQTILVKMNVCCFHPNNASFHKFRCHCKSGIIFTYNISLPTLQGKPFSCLKILVFVYYTWKPYFLDISIEFYISVSSITSMGLFSIGLMPIRPITNSSTIIWSTMIPSIRTLST